MHTVFLVVTIRNIFVHRKRKHNSQIRDCNSRWFEGYRFFKLRDHGNLDPTTYGRNQATRRPSDTPNSFEPSSGCRNAKGLGWGWLLKYSSRFTLWISIYYIKNLNPFELNKVYPKHTDRWSLLFSIGNICSLWVHSPNLSFYSCSLEMFNVID